MLFFFSSSHLVIWMFYIILNVNANTTDNIDKKYFFRQFDTGTPTALSIGSYTAKTKYNDDGTYFKGCKW